MNTEEFNIIDIVKIIIKNHLIKFLIYFIILVIIIGPILLFLQKNIITDKYNVIKFEIFEIDRSSNQDFLLFDKINNLFQSTITQKFNEDTTTTEEIFFNQSFDYDKYFNLFIQFVSNDLNINSINEKLQTSLKIHNNGYREDVVLGKNVFFVEFHDYEIHDEKKYYKFIKELQDHGLKKMNERYISEKKEFEINNTIILESLYIYIEEQKKNYFNKQDLSSKDELVKLNSASTLINRYLSRLNKKNNDYLGNIVEYSELQIATISNISINQINSNITFVFFRSFILSIVISLILVFFFFIFKIDFINKKNI